MLENGESSRKLQYYLYRRLDCGKQIEFSKIKSKETNNLSTW